LVNLTNHAYFNLGDEPLLSQSLFIDSDQTLEMGSNLIPTGSLLPTKNTPYDFTKYPKLKNLESIGGLDTIFWLNESSMERPKVRYLSKSSGLEMKVYSDQPSIVVFAPPKLVFEGTPKNNSVDYSKYPAICFEAQWYPDSINHDNFPNCLLKKGHTYTQRTKFSFDILN